MDKCQDAHLPDGIFQSSLWNVILHFMNEILKRKMTHLTRDDRINTVHRWDSYQREFESKLITDACFENK